MLKAESYATEPRESGQVRKEAAISGLTVCREGARTELEALLDPGQCFEGGCMVYYLMIYQSIMLG